ncbi:MAG: hypothetical protein ACE5GX_13945 [Thermoanaerobaculia bacterium]
MFWKQPGVALLAAVLGLAAGVSCSGKLEAPPVEVTSRESLVGAGNIVRVKNQTNEPLFNVEVTIRAAKGEVAYREGELIGYETLEVGWKKLGGFEIPDDAEVRVRAEGYMLRKSVKLDASASGDEQEGSS